MRRRAAALRCCTAWAADAKSSVTPDRAGDVCGSVPALALGDHAGVPSAPAGGDQCSHHRRCIRLGCKKTG